MNFCLQIWLECSEWPHTKLFLALVITIEPWLPPQPSLLEYIESCISITINNNHNLNVAGFFVNFLD